MAKVITTELQHSGASGANITLDSSKNVTCENNLTVDGTTTLTGAVTLPNNTVTNAKVADDAIGIAELSASGTASSSTFLRGDNSWAAAGGGKLLQMVGNSSNNNTVISSTSYSTTNMSQTITPSKTGSKMLFMCAGHYSQNHNGGSHGPQVQVAIYKKIGSGTDTEIHTVTYDYTAVNNVYNSHHFAATYFDPTATLNTTDDIKYTIYAKLLYASHQMRFNPSSYTSLVVQEYDA